MAEQGSEGSQGILAVWNDCTPGNEAEYETWYQFEHLPERLSVPGFIVGRRYQAIDAQREFFTYYEVTTPDVLTSPDYRRRLDSPTPATRRIMSGIFVNMVRSIGRCVFRQGAGRGSHALTIEGVQTDAAIAYAKTLADSAHVARVELWQAEPDVAEQSAEEQLRGGDKAIESCLFIETLRADDLAGLTGAVQAFAAGAPQTYRLVSELRS